MQQPLLAGDAGHRRDADLRRKLGDDARKLRYVIEARRLGYRMPETDDTRGCLDPAQCAVLRGQGESMEPTTAAGSSILVDRSRTRRRVGQIFVLRTAEGMVAKRTVKVGDGGWRLESDHPDCEPVAFPEDAVILGRVVWAARALV